MLRLYFLFIASFIVTGAKAQVEPLFCDINLIPKDPADLTIPNIVAEDAQSYQALIEVNKAGNALTEMIRELFTSTDFVAVAVQTIEGVSTKTFSDYGKNELLAVFNYGTPKATCKTYDLRENSFLTPYEIEIVNGKDVAVSPLSKLFHKAGFIEFVYTGSSNFVRGIPVNEWVTCLSDPRNSNILSRITYSFSNPKKWLPPTLTQGFEAVPVQILYENYNSKTKAITTDVYAITDFKPFASTEEMDYIQPSGVYCPGKVNTKEVPPIPQSFTYLMTTVAPTQVYAGFVENEQIFYDSHLNLFSYRFVNEDVQNYEIHDFNTGISYNINQKTGVCKFGKLTPDSIDVHTNDLNKLRLRTPEEFFNLDNAGAQYVGQRRVDGINADVWLGSKLLPGKNFNTTFEWYFMSSYWTRPAYKTKTLVPILMIQTDMISDFSGQLVPFPVSNHINHFYYSVQAVKYDSVFKYCNSSLEVNHYGFSVPLDKEDLIRKYEPEFRLGVLRTMQKIAQVTYLRINEIEIAFNGLSVYVLFSLYEKSSFYGDVDVLADCGCDDVVLERADKLLKTKFSNGTDVTIKLELPDEKSDIEILIDQGSFNQVADKDNQNTILRQSVSDLGYSGGSVFFLCVFALVIGGVVSILIAEMHKFKMISIPFLKAD